MTAHASHSLTLGECQQKKKKTTKKNNNRVNAMGWRGGQRERERGGGSGRCPTTVDRIGSGTILSCKYITERSNVSRNAGGCRFAYFRRGSRRRKLGVKRERERGL
jgi:hypothetical protein